MKQQLQKIDWDLVAEKMHDNGFTIIPNFSTENECEDLKAGYDNPKLTEKRLYRNTTVLVWVDTNISTIRCPTLLNKSEQTYICTLYLLLMCGLKR